MSRRKQSNPRQFKRLLSRAAHPGLFENGQEDLDDRECEDKEILKDEEATVDQEMQFPLDSENIPVKNEDDPSAGEADGRQEAKKGDSGKNPSSPTVSGEWDGPRELEAVSIGAEAGVRSRQALPPGTTWGPFTGKIERSTGGNDTVPLVLTGGPPWLMNVTWVSADDSRNNCVVYSKGGHVWCSTTRSVMEGEELAVCVVDISSRLASIQLLPQQAAMASVLPSTIINKDIFPCKMCGIWFRSDRNLQAHLMYYCSGRTRESDLASEKQTNTNHPMSHSCTYPQCNMSFLGPQALKMHLSTHSAFKPDETSPGSSLKCTICDYTADTLMVLQPHILTHLSQTGLRCGQCHFTFQTPRDLSKHQELHRHASLDSKSTKQDPIGSLSVANLNDNKSTRESQVNQNKEREPSGQVQGASKANAGCGSKAGFSYSKVKSEPSSPRLASSPIQNHMTPAFPVPPFLPHVPFSQDVPAVPQASEILAKMSELVHRRLRQGGNNFPPVMYSTLVPKGATCFECNITFSNLDNYLVHKKHYCNGRWQHMSKPHDYGILTKPAVSPETGGGLASMLNTGQAFEIKGQNPTQLNTPPVEPFSTGGKAPEEFPANGKKATTPCDEEESPKDSKSQKTSESELDYNQTTCEACKITFSRQENYVVHKQYYCATRHDPPAKRAANNKHVQKSFRTRKRRKMPSPDPVASQTYPYSSSYMSQDSIESLKDQLHHRYSMIQGLVPKHPEPSLTVTKSALVSKCNAIAEEEGDPGDAPIDLSKKCTIQMGKVSGLMDYHECAVCNISFNKVEDYLSHKQNFCPGAISENKPPNVKDEASRLANAPDSFSIERSVQCANNSTSAETQSAVKDEDKTMSSDNYPGNAKRIRADEQIWPYYEIKPADYATGIFVPQNERRQSPNEGTEGEKEQPMPDGSHVGSETTEKSLSTGLQGDGRQESASCSTSIPNVHFTARPPDQGKPNESISPSPASNLEETSTLKRSTNSVALNGKYCRPCDIQFNNLSNFITHKKFYCSAHTTEHVK